jgi:carboxyl-terminal processing protease
MDFNDSKGRSSAKDVLEQIEKLKEEGMEGLVFDLRNNGGASLIDAVRIAGYFIEKGPVVQVKSRYGAPFIFDDKDSRVQYDGPLVVLVNAVSASASEIFAAAMQDYQRAIIIGSTRTFGKGTVQRFFELDKMVDPAYEEIKPLGSVKLTTQKFYRINGDATQLKGVIPDLVLPDRYAYVDIGEKERDYPMPWSEISPTTFQPWSNFSIDYDYLKKKERKKVLNDPTFRLLDEQARFLRSQRDESLIPLNLEEHRQWKAGREAASTKYKELGKDSLNLQVFSLKHDLESIAGDTAKAESTRKWHKQLVKDVYLYEAIHLLIQEGIVKVD